MIFLYIIRNFSIKRNNNLEKFIFKGRKKQFTEWLPESVLLYFPKPNINFATIPTSQNLYTEFQRIRHTLVDGENFSVITTPFGPLHLIL